MPVHRVPEGAAARKAPWPKKFPDYGLDCVLSAPVFVGEWVLPVLLDHDTGSYFRSLIVSPDS